MIYCQTGHTRYIPCIYHVYAMHIPCEGHLQAFLVAHPLGSLRLGLPSELLSFGHREAAHARLGPSKDPRPGADLVNMAAPPRGHGRAAPSAQPHSKASFCRLLYLCGIVEVAFPSRKHGMSGTRPRRSSTLAT
jgi:hypothetical protein